MVLLLGLLVDAAEIVSGHLAILLPDADVEDHAQLDGDILHLQLPLGRVLRRPQHRAPVRQGPSGDQQHQDDDEKNKNTLHGQTPTNTVRTVYHNRRPLATGPVLDWNGKSCYGYG